MVDEGLTPIGGPVGRKRSSNRRNSETEFEPRGTPCNESTWAASAALFVRSTVAVLLIRNRSEQIVHRAMELVQKTRHAKIKTPYQRQEC